MKEFIFGSRDQYKVLENGKIFSRTTSGCRPKNLDYWRELNPVFAKCDYTGNGYFHTGLNIDGKSKSYKVHRIVALYLVDGYKEGLHVNHIDGNRANNCASNLEWVTPKENISNAKERGAKFGTTLGGKLKRSDIIEMINNGIRNNEISKKFNIDQSVISNIRHRKKCSYKEFHHLVINPLPSKRKIK